ncbi:hypothetical protein EDD18DRAFT_1109093 [Armillaria luteobubalina]|uniref:Uncharacterized protein n=1 Tax=Armillaria luteobubalina TaxID=153913 RepID=A0AA39UPZ2_9AGAR|nr:hypothetical protein EDD18DRAFT_1109093 [Armillaria luteobubalina]
MYQHLFFSTTIMDATLLSNALERMSMEDIVKLKNQALQEENHRLLTIPSVPNTTRSPVLSRDGSGAAAGGSAYDLASNTKMPSLFNDKESQKELEYCAMKMVIFRRIWFERKGLFGIGLELARRKLDAVTLTNAIDMGMERPSLDRILVLRLVLKLYEYLPNEGGWKPLTVKLPQPGFNCHKDLDCWCLLGFKSVGVYDRHPPCLFAGNFKSGATIFRTIYGVRVNSVAIAFATIVTCYLLSGDTDFAAVGKKSSINYMADFKYYVAHLEDQLKKGMTLMHTTVKFYNDHIFPMNRDHRYQVPTTVPKSLNEEEEDFWHEIEALDKEPDFDSDDPAPPITPVVSVHTPSAISSQVDLPAMPATWVTNDSEAQLGMADANDNVRSRAKGKKGKKGKKGSNKAVPMATRVTCGRGGQGGVPAEAEAPVPQAM